MTVPGNPGPLRAAPAADGRSAAAPPRNAHLFAELDLERAERQELGPGLAAVYTCRSPFKDSPNEDACLLVRIDCERAVLAVADGVGGLPGARHAARVALQSLADVLRGAARSTAPLRGRILDGVERAHRAVGELRQGAATTLVVAEIHGARMRSYHVGDSGLLVVGQRGRMRLQTTFHSPVGYALEAGLLDEREAIHHADRHLISNALGHEGMHVEVGSTLDLRPRDTLLLASDGLFDNLHTAEIAERVRKGELGAALDAVVELCRRRMQGSDPDQPCKPDDLTLIAFRRRVPPSDA